MKLHFQVVAVAARKLSDAQEFAKKHNIPQAYGSYEELANDPNIGELEEDPSLLSFTVLIGDVSSPNRGHGDVSFF